jgi:hypothetical protein
VYTRTVGRLICNHVTLSNSRIQNLLMTPTPLTFRSPPSINPILFPKSQTTRLPYRPRRRGIRQCFCALLQDPRASIHALIMHIIHTVRIVLSLAPEQRHDVLHAELADELAALERSCSELALGFLQL